MYRSASESAGPGVGYKAEARAAPLQSLSAGCIGMLLRFLLATHSLPFGTGRRSGIPRDRRLCQHCSLHASHDERHFCSNTLPCRLSGTINLPYLALHRAACSCSCSSLMLVPHGPGDYAHFVLDCFVVVDLLGAAPYAHDIYLDSDSSLSALAAE